MIAMEFKGITWVGNMYEKFEAMCLEVEEVMYQDTVQYVESQVQTVSSSVKKFYSDVMQDLLPPSTLDPHTDVEIYKKPKARNNKDPIKVDKKITEESELIADVDENDTPSIRKLCDTDHKNEICLHSNVGINKNAEISESHEVTGYDSFDKREIFNDVVRETSSSADASSDFPVYEIIQNFESSAKKGSKLRCTSSSDGPGGLSVESCAADIHMNNEVVSPMGSCVTENTRFSESVENSGHMDVIENSNITDPEMKTNEHFNKLKLEETCVLVDGNELLSVPHPEGKRRSYKKKIREAFSSKMKLARKEYEQLAVRYEDIVDTRSNEEISSDRQLPTLTSNADAKNVPAHDFCESEWELL